MTITEMQDMTEDFLTVKQVATCLRCDPQLIRDQAERNPRYLDFPICKIGHSYKIPRLGFIAWAKGEQMRNEQQYALMLSLLKRICSKKFVESVNPNASWGNHPTDPEMA